MSVSPSQVLQTLLSNPLDLANVKSVTTPDVTYVSLNEHNPELKATYHSRDTGKDITSPFSVFAKLSNGKISYIQFMEDTFGTSGTQSA
jgi:uncharacterized protein